MGFAFIAPAAMLAAQVIVSFTSIVAPVLAPLAAADLGVDPELVGFHVALVYGVCALSSLLSGGFIRRFGPLRIVQASLVLAAAAAAIFALGTVAAALAGAVALGLCYGPMTPSSSQILQRTTPPRRINLVFSIKQTGVPGGTFLAGLVLPSLAGLIGWQAALAGLAALACAFALALQPLRAHLDDERDPARPAFRLGHIGAMVRELLRDARLRRITIVAVCYTGMQQALAGFLVVYLTTRIGLPLVAAGALLAASQGAGAVGRIAWGLLADRLGRPQLVMGGLGLAMTACALAAGAFTADWPVAAIALVCVAFGGTATAWNGVYLAQVARFAPAGRAGEFTGVSNFFGFAGVMIVPALFSAILATTGSYAIGFAAIAAATGIGALAILREPAGAR